MNLKFEVSGRINRPVEDVFEAVADPKQLSGYFTTGGAKGRLEAGATVIWDFHDFPGAFPVNVVDVEENKRIVLEWDGDGTDGVKTTVTIRFEPTEDGTPSSPFQKRGGRQRIRACRIPTAIAWAGHK